MGLHGRLHGAACQEPLVRTSEGRCVDAAARQRRKDVRAVGLGRDEGDGGRGGGEGWAACSCALLFVAGWWSGLAGVAGGVLRGVGVRRGEGFALCR